MLGSNQIFININTRDPNIAKNSNLKIKSDSKLINPNLKVEDNKPNEKKKMSNLQFDPNVLLLLKNKNSSTGKLRRLEYNKVNSSNNLMSVNKFKISQNQNKKRGVSNAVSSKSNKSVSNSSQVKAIKADPFDLLIGDKRKAINNAKSSYQISKYKENNFTPKLLTSPKIEYIKEISPAKQNKNVKLKKINYDDKPNESYLLSSNNISVFHSNSKKDTPRNNSEPKEAKIKKISILPPPINKKTKTKEVKIQTSKSRASKTSKASKNRELNKRHKSEAFEEVKEDIYKKLIDFNDHNTKSKSKRESSYSNAKNLIKKQHTISRHKRVKSNNLTKKEMKTNLENINNQLIKLQSMSNSQSVEEDDDSLEDIEIPKNDENIMGIENQKIDIPNNSIHSKLDDNKTKKKNKFSLSKLFCSIFVCGSKHKSII